MLFHRCAKIYLLVVSVCCVFLNPSNTLAYSTIWCNPQNTGLENGLSKSSGYNTLWKAMSAMAQGDTVVIANGDYRNTQNMYIDAQHLPPDGTPDAYSTVRAETDWEVKLPQIQIITTAFHSYMMFRGIVFDNKFINTGSGHLLYRVNHIKFIRCGFLAHGLTGNNHTAGFGNDLSDRSVNSYNLMEECIIWGSGRYVLYEKYGSNNIFRRCIARHDLHLPYGEGDKDGGQIFNFRSYACSNSVYQNCISIDSDRVENYNYGNLNPEAGGFWIGDQYGTDGNIITGCMSIKDVQLPYYLSGNGTGTTTINNSIAIDVPVAGYTTLSAMILKSNVNVYAENIVGIGGRLLGQDGFYGKNDGSFTITNSILKDINDFGVFSLGNTYINHYNAGAGTWDNGATSYNPQENGLLYPVRIEQNSPLYNAGSSGGICGAEILKKIGVSGTLYGETGWNSVTEEDLWPFPNEDKIKELMSVTVDGVSGEYGFCTGNSLDGSPQTLTKYIWEYLGNQIPNNIYKISKPTPPTGLSIMQQ